MINIYKTIDGKIVEIDEIEKHAWINMVNPTEEELLSISDQLNVEEDFLRAALDEEEICLQSNTIIDDFAKGRVKHVFTNLKTRFIFQMLYRVATRFLVYLRHINRMSTEIEKELHRSMKNKELIQLLDLEKSLVFFSTSLKANQSVLEKLQRGRVIKLYEDDRELLEDVLIEVEQAIEMSNIYSNILSGTMDAFASIISNNLNIVMKVLTSITILMAIPTMVSSFYGMNVSGLPFANFGAVVIIVVILTALVAIILFRKNMFS